MASVGEDRNPLMEARFLISAADLRRLPPAGAPEVAFAGRSNAGKSSALNALCGRTGLARVSKTPGRTQLLNFFELPRGRLVDLPGYGYAAVTAAQREAWGLLVSGYLLGRPGLRGVVLVADVRRGLTDLDRQMLDWGRSLPTHVLLTKSDKLAAGAARATLRAVRVELESLRADATVQLFSAPQRTGVDEARRRVAAWLGEEAPGTPAAGE